jgi:hypothetical protein
MTANAGPVGQYNAIEVEQITGPQPLIPPLHNALDHLTQKANSKQSVNKAPLSE